MRIEVVNTGSELLLGKVVNTHAAYFGQELFKLGLRVQRQTTIPDGDEIESTLLESFPRADVILVTGGLGPTSDDVTREIVAKMLGRELILDQAILDEINEMFRSRGYTPSQLNDRQAMVPEGGIVLDNPNGTAPGLYLPSDEQVGSPHLFLIPGPPRELKPMFEALIYPRIAELREEAHENDTWHNFRIYGVGESALASDVEPRLEEFPDLEIGYCARLGEVDLRLIGPDASVTAGAAIVREVYREDIVAEAETSIEQVIVEQLSDQGATVATAESCTGGNIASTITDVPGSSAVLREGFVTYSNEAKMKYLGVPADLIEANGAVSEAVVRAMAEGCLAETGATHAVAVSGIAGPGGGSEDKPVGTVYIGIASQGQETFAKRYFNPMDRLSFKRRTTRLVLDLLRRRLAGFRLD